MRRPAEPDRERLGRYVRERRLALDDMTIRQACAAAGGMALQTWTSVEQGKSVSDRTLRRVETALRWAPGSAQDVLDGGEPTELAAPATIEPRPITDQAVLQRLAEIEAKYAAELAAMQARLEDMEARERERDAKRS
jgi:hypothetical protein